MMDKSVSTINGSTFCKAISLAKAKSTVAFALMAAAASTPTQIECSDEPCVIRITFIPSLLNDSKSLLLKPGTPIMPLPSKLIKAILLMLVMPRIKCSLAAALVSIMVPSSVGAKVFFTQTGMPLLNTGCMVGG